MRYLYACVRMHTQAHETQQLHGPASGAHARASRVSPAHIPMNQMCMSVCYTHSSSSPSPQRFRVLPQRWSHLLCSKLCIQQFNYAHIPDFLQPPPHHPQHPSAPARTHAHPLHPRASPRPSHAPLLQLSTLCLVDSCSGPNDPTMPSILASPAHQPAIRLTLPLKLGRVRAGPRAQ